MKYTRPQLKITEMSSEDIIRTSIVVEDAPKTSVGTYENVADYGTQDFSIFAE